MWMLFVGVVINYLDRSNLSIVAPRISADLHLTPATLGMTFSAFGWTYALLQLPASRLVDRISPRMLFAIALMLWSSATFLMGFAQTFASLFALRLAVGALEAPTYPINNRVVTQWFPERERAGAIGVYTSGQFVGLAFLTPVLASIANHYGWRLIFQLTGALGVVWAIAWWSWYRDPTERQNTSEDELLLITQVRAQSAQGNRATPKNTALWRDLGIVLGRRKLWGLYIGQFGLASVQWFFLTWFPTYLVIDRHIALAKAGFYSSLPYLSAFIGVISGGLFSDWLLRLGTSITAARKIPIVTGSFLASVIVLGNQFHDPHLVIACMACSSFGCGFASITWSIVSTMAPEHLIGLTGGAFNFISNLSAIVVPIVVGLLIRGDSFTRPLAYIAAMAIMGIVAFVFLVGKIERIEV
jgi:ACS family D-galactonate transporter-like MFS transporter